jgi:hypothetical protein
MVVVEAGVLVCVERMEPQGAFVLLVVELAELVTLLRLPPRSDGRGDFRLEKGC